ncbi:alanine--tRNA ligase [Parenemella sanctibonifatiensis]|uniref:Alanine--tRNA ligase n=1 Tax=Parenemella sanctibonifatiensis TaxID=2016505 RepID=A0A255EHN7_9ACTN|nr:alanine--tRNA ligase [Parenemella sanctibonifatiensis]OYN91036.1 alanine--tRNA ligase [Parenemella sanctibonifatiensis]
MKTAEIRQRYLDFFARHGHAVVPSAPLIHSDPNLLFVVAGMVPMVPYFTGAEPAPWKRAVSVQKCIRTLDIEEVGKTTRHGTFFQMLGNFSFGDYFKAEVIPWTWEFLTGSVEDGNLGFDGDRLYVSVLGPGHHPSYPDGDVEAREIWRSIGLPDERIVSRNLTENYWHMGVPGPGGPDSEIFYDRGPEYGPADLDAGEDRYLEIWNNVFQQEELSAVRGKDDFDVARPLPSKNIDTGAGLERMAYLLQGKNNLYEIDEVFPVVQRSAELAGISYGDREEADVQLRVVGDHVRSALMLMTDGVTPGNEARSYVLRRLLRRTVRSLRLLGVTDAVLPELLQVSRDVMSASYPDVLTQWERVSSAAAAEEQAFTRTLDAGTQIFDTAVRQTLQESGSTLTGERAFALHDTYGFPIELTVEMAQEQGLEVDTEAFRSLMTEQRERAKADARAKKGGAASVEAYRELRGQGETTFVGYTDLVADTTVAGLIVDGQVVDRVPAGQVAELVLPVTPLYAEAGGQDADAGQITGDGLALEVLDVQRPVPGLVVHQVRVDAGELHLGQQVHAAVDPQARLAASRAHTATHIIHAALRQVVGPNALQAGSYNKPGYLRFDFNASEGLSADMRAEIEGISNEAIGADYAVTDQQLPLSEAKERGAMAMFGEKYPPIVRMVELNGPWSRELCGGTHVERTAQIGLLSLLGESSVGAGVRRVEALVSKEAFQQLAAERALVANLSGMLKVQPDQLAERIEKLVTDLKSAERTIAQAQKDQALAAVPTLVAAAEEINGVRLVASHQPQVTGNDLRGMATAVRDQLGQGPGVVALIGGQDKPQLVVATTAAAREQGWKAGDLVRDVAAVLGGRGGGKPDLAQGGGTDGTKIPDALAAVRTALAG